MNLTTRRFALLPRLLAAASLAGAISGATASPIFADNFESGLGQWNPVGSAQVVTDPFSSGNSVLKFKAGGSGGDIFSAQPYLQGGTYFLSFDILGTCSTGNCGGFIGIDQFPGGEIWIAGDNTYGNKLYLMQNNGAWQHFDFKFTANASGTFRLKIEDFVSSPPPGDVYFDNVCVSGTAGDAGCPTTSVPEPASLALAGLALLAAGSTTRRGLRRRG